MAITFLDYTFDTELSTTDIERIFRSRIKRPANAVLKLARLNWHFISPDEDANLFSPLGPLGELSLAQAAYFSPKKISATIMAIQESLNRSAGGLILLGVKDGERRRAVHICHVDNTGAKSCVRNFINGLAAADPSINVNERKRLLSD
jgi:hypothetical protein